MNSFRGRTIQVVNDFSIDEQLYLYEQTRNLKRAALEGGNRVDSYRVGDPELGVYLIFLEDSTRTRESFRNAAKFHRAKVNEFGLAGSSFAKSESITDTVKMLAGYSSNSVFIMRTPHEGTCRWLEDAVGDYCESHGMHRPAFINAGDGRHEHPTQEFLDEFSFLEALDWDRSHIHLALVGDLLHGRTVHSKVNGLRLFGEVEVDLVAPAEITMPDHYSRLMESYGFRIRRFASIEEYLSQRKVAPLWYFTRLQLERMGEKLRDRASALRDAVTFRREFLPRVPEEVRFFHPLPRHRETPVIPSFLDQLPLNAWDQQSVNGYYTRIIEIALLAGQLGSDFSGAVQTRPVFSDDFVEEQTGPAARPKGEYKVGIKPVSNGIVIDHIAVGQNPESIWNQVNKIRRTLGLNCVSSHGVFASEQTGRYKGLISLPDVTEFDERLIKMLGAISPGCTLNLITNEQVQRKYRLRMPPRVYNLAEIRCKNPGCISHPQYAEPVVVEFYRSSEEDFVCRYCETPHTFSEIWS